MKRNAQTRSAILLFLAVFAAGAQADEGDPRQYVGEARDIAQEFAARLKGELESALEEGGASQAIGVCGAAAPAIGARLGKETGWAVGRTALRVRNPRNAPDSRERAVMTSFQQQHAEGVELQGMERIGIVEEGGLRYVHYMKPIPTQEVCLTCHGGDVKGPIQQALAERYPADAATGFREGEMRGAFTFIKPLEGR
ncbi:Tll0287-like domain-containing protein [Ectothiorhodospira mobilis]|uniref:Tll0287-like domain-containing protein n=1 Tax=Ectothiorhodospira mobilis TaxID=195064 RepID=UPI001907DC27|nr:DUF3365 domain-containing protein [Ectothiorhodospira mobilis]